MSAQGLYAEFTNRAADFAPSIDVGNELDEVEFDYSHVVHILTSQVGPFSPNIFTIQSN